MSPKRESYDYISDILDAMSKAQKFLQGVSYESFLRDDKTQAAVEREIEIIGEAAGNIPNSIHKKYPEIPWQKIIGMRNKLAHEYFGVRIMIVWNVVKEDIPVIQPLFEKLWQDYIHENKE